MLKPNQKKPQASEPEKPSPKEVKKISKAKSLLGISKDNKEKGKALPIQSKKRQLKPNLHQKQTSLS
jgi:hypothetical protein